MANFGPKPSTNPLGKKLNFSTFSTPCFYSLKRHFFALKYHKTHFPGLNCLNKQNGKMTNFGPKRWTNPFKKNLNFSTFSSSCFYSLERRFTAIEYHKTHFPGPDCPKKTRWKNGIFWTIFMDYAYFSTFSTFCFYSL